MLARRLPGILPTMSAAAATTRHGLKLAIRNVTDLPPRRLGFASVPQAVWRGSSPTGVFGVLTAANLERFPVLVG